METSVDIQDPQLIEEVDSNNASSLQCVKTLTGNKNYVVEAFVDEKFAYIGCWDGGVRSYDLRIPSALMKETSMYKVNSKVRALYVLKNFGRILIGDSSGNITITSKAPTMKKIHDIKAHDADILAFASAEDVGLFFSVGLDKKIKVWKCDTYELVRTLDDPLQLWGAASSKYYLYTADEVGGIKCWSIPNLELVKDIDTKQTGIRRLYYNDDRDWLVSCGSNGSAKVYDATTYTLLGEVKNSAAVQCAWIINDILLCGTKAGNIEVWNLKDYTKNTSHRYGPVWVNCMTCFQNKVIVCGGGDCNLQFWHGAGSYCYKMAANISAPIPLWTPNDVADWASDKGFASYSGAFVSNGVDGKILFRLNEFDIREDIGVKHIATRKKLMDTITELSKEASKSPKVADKLDFDPDTLSGTIGKLHSHPMTWKQLESKLWLCNECGNEYCTKGFVCEVCDEILCPLCFVGKPSYSYDLFLSHRQANGADVCQSIKLQLENMDPSLRIFLDVDDLAELHSLERKVRFTRVFLFLITDGALHRPFVQQEILTALKLKKPIILVHDEKSCPFPSGTMLDGVPIEVREILNIKAIPYIREKSFRTVSIKEIFNNLNKHR